MKNSLFDDPSDMEMLESEIWINDFDEQTVRRFRKQVLKYSMMGSDAPIVIYIDSYGGYADSLMAMIDIMESVQNPFITVAVGKAVSCGAILLSCGDYRYCGRNARIMIHRSSAGTFGNMRNMVSDLKEMERLDRYIMDIFAKNCGLENVDAMLDKFKEHNADDLWMSADDAKAFGLIDYIGMPHIAPIVRWGSAIHELRDPAGARKSKKATEIKAEEAAETDSIKPCEDRKKPSPPKRRTTRSKRK